MNSDRPDIDRLLLIKFHKFHNTLPKRRDSQGRILHILSEHEGISQKKLQEIVGIKAGSLSEVLVKLEKQGYITRIHEDADRRCQNVFITDAGKEAYNKIHAEHLETGKDVFKDLTDEEKILLLGLLDKLLEEKGQHFKHAEREDNSGGFEN